MNVFGVDYSRSMINISSKQFQMANSFVAKQIKFLFKKNKFDAIIIFSSIQYFPDKKYFKNVLLKINKILKKNSFLYIGEIVEKKINKII